MYTMPRFFEVALMIAVGIRRPRRLSKYTANIRLSSIRLRDEISEYQFLANRMGLLNVGTEHENA